MLVGVELLEGEGVAFGQRRQLGRRVVGGQVFGAQRGLAAALASLDLLSRGLLVDGQEALELEGRALGAQEVRGARGGVAEMSTTVSS